MRFTDIEDNIRSGDTVEQRTVYDIRKPKLFLSHLNKLRKQRELRSLEIASDKKKLSLIYGTPPEGDGMSQF